MLDDAYDNTMVYHPGGGVHGCWLDGWSAVCNLVGTAHVSLENGSWMILVGSGGTRIEQAFGER